MSVNSVQPTASLRPAGQANEAGASRSTEGTSPRFGHLLAARTQQHGAARGEQAGPSRESTSAADSRHPADTSEGRDTREPRLKPTDIEQHANGDAPGAARDSETVADRLSLSRGDSRSHEDSARSRQESDNPAVDTPQARADSDPSITHWLEARASGERAVDGRALHAQGDKRGDARQPDLDQKALRRADDSVPAGDAEQPVSPIALTLGRSLADATSGSSSIDGRLDAALARAKDTTPRGASRLETTAARGEREPSRPAARAERDGGEIKSDAGVRDLLLADLNIDHLSRNAASRSTPGLDPRLLAAATPGRGEAFADAVAADGRTAVSTTGTTDTLAGASTITPATAGSAAAAASGATPAVPAPPVFTASLDAPMGSERWQEAMTQQSLRLSHFRDGSAQLTLHPRDLGALNVSLKMGEQAQMHFSSAHADVRAAVEAALPQLRQAFADQGITLGETTVGDEPQSQASGDGPASNGGRGNGRTDSRPGDTDSDMTAIQRMVPLPGRTSDGGIDIFA